MDAERLRKIALAERRRVIDKKEAEEDWVIREEEKRLQQKAVCAAPLRALRSLLTDWEATVLRHLLVICSR